MKFIGVMNNILGGLVLLIGSTGIVIAGGYYETIALREAAYYAQIKIIANQPLTVLAEISTR